MWEYNRSLINIVHTWLTLNVILTGGLIDCDGYPPTTEVPSTLLARVESLMNSFPSRNTTWANLTLPVIFMTESISDCGRCILTETLPFTGMNCTVGSFMASNKALNVALVSVELISWAAIMNDDLVTAVLDPWEREISSATLSKICKILF